MSQPTDNSAPDHAAILAQMAQIHASSTDSSYHIGNGYQYMPSKGMDTGVSRGGIGPSNMQNIQSSSQQQQTIKQSRSNTGNTVPPSLGAGQNSLRDSALSDDVEGEGQDDSDESSEEGEDDNDDGDQDGEGGEGDENRAGKGRDGGRGRNTSGASGTPSGSVGPSLGFLPDGSVRKKPKLTRGSR